MYYILVQSGVVFEGSLNDFKNKFYDYPATWTDEQIIAHAKNWAEDNGWSFEFNLLN